MVADPQLLVFFVDHVRFFALVDFSLFSSWITISYSPWWIFRQTHRFLVVRPVIRFPGRRSAEGFVCVAWFWIFPCAGAKRILILVKIHAGGFPVLFLSHRIEKLDVF
jgi:hypothetical protein